MSGKRKQGWFQPLLSVQNAVLCAAGVYCLVLLDLNKSELASWVQAVGSIAAIWGALSINRAQLASQETARRQEIIVRAEAMHAVVEMAVKDMESMKDLAAQNYSLDLFKSAVNNFSGEHFKCYLNALKTVPVNELGSYSLVGSHLIILSSMISMGHQLNVIMEKNAHELSLMPSDWLQRSYNGIIGYYLIAQLAWTGFQRAHAERVDSLR